MIFPLSSVLCIEYVCIDLNSKDYQENMINIKRDRCYELNSMHNHIFENILMWIKSFCEKTIQISNKCKYVLGKQISLFEVIYV